MSSTKMVTIDANLRRMLSAQIFFASSPDGDSAVPLMRDRDPRREGSEAAEIACRLNARFGGRYSRELGIDVDAGGARIDEWFCAATLFGTRISASTAVRAYGALADAGVHTVLDAGERSWEDLVGLLDAGGYGRYDFRTATRLQQLAAEGRTRFGGTVASLATVTDPRVLEATLDALPGWGLTTVRIFLRELRDVWPGAQPPLDERALRDARHLKIPLPRRRSDQIDALRAVADGVQRMCGISRLRSYASAWRIAICARVRVVAVSEVRLSGGGFVVMTHLRGELPSPALSGSGVLGVTDRSRFLSLLRLPRRLADFTDHALSRHACPGPEVPIRPSTRRGTRSRSAARVCRWYRRPRALRRRGVAHGECLERAAHTGRTPLDEPSATGGCFVLMNA